MSADSSPSNQFSLLQLLALFTVLAALLALTVRLHLWSFPLWLAALLMWLILQPRRGQAWPNSHNTESKSKSDNNRPS